MAWIGLTDLGAEKRGDVHGLGPIAHALTECSFTHAVLLSPHSDEVNDAYYRWLRLKAPKVEVEIYPAKLTSPSDFREICENARSALDKLRTKIHRDKDINYSLTFHLSPGTPIMAAVWILLAKTLYPADLIESSRWKEEGVKKVDVPYDIKLGDIEQLRADTGAISAPPGFSKLKYKSDVMINLVNEAARVAPYDDIPVLILGESGTGKEVFARAIHEESPRRKHRFVAINCGAIPATLLESELFGHTKDAYTGATRETKGCFELADNGTLFLDEIGEMPKDLQVKLLRALQEKEIKKVGRDDEMKVNIRLIAATNKNIYADVASGEFRNDLFWRIAAGKILELPPLIERKEDISLLIDHFLEEKNKQYEGKPGWKRINNISPEARKLLYDHSWTGNVRELESTITRAALTAQGKTTIQKSDVEKSILLKARRGTECQDSGILNRTLEDGFSLDRLLEEVEAHYIKRAIEQTMKNGRTSMTSAAKIVGYSHQTFSNRKKKCMG